MTHTKVIKFPLGVIEITVSLAVECLRNETYWSYSVAFTPKGKKKSIDGATLVTPEEIQQTKTELWLKLKP